MLFSTLVVETGLNVRLQIVKRDLKWDCQTKHIEPKNCTSNTQSEKCKLEKNKTLLQRQLIVKTINWLFKARKHLILVFFYMYFCKSIQRKK